MRIRGARSSKRGLAHFVGTQAAKKITVAAKSEDEAQLGCTQEQRAGLLWATLRKWMGEGGVAKDGWNGNGG